MKTLSKDELRRASLEAAFYSSLELIGIYLRISVAVGGAQGGVSDSKSLDTSDIACQALLNNSSIGDRSNADDTTVFYTVIWCLAIWSAVVHIPNIFYRLRRVRSLRHLYSHGYRKHWKYKQVMKLDNLLRPDGASNFREMKRDYRVTLDMRVFNFHVSAMSVFTAIICDLPWSFVMIYKINVNAMGTLEQLSLATAGVSMGSKFKNVLSLLHNYRQYRVAVKMAGKLIQLVPSDVQCATGISTVKNPQRAVDHVWTEVTSQLKLSSQYNERGPSWIIMSSSGRNPHLLRDALNSLDIPKNAAVVGMSSCAGIAVNGKFRGRNFVEPYDSLAEDIPVFSMFAVSDTDGIYEAEHADFEDLDDVPTKVVEARVRAMTARIMKRHDKRISAVKSAPPMGENNIEAQVFLKLHEEGKPPSIVWLESATIPLEVVINILQAEWGQNIRCVGGSAADEKLRNGRMHLIHPPLDVSHVDRSEVGRSASTVDPSEIELNLKKWTVQTKSKTPTFSTTCCGISIVACWPSVQLRTAFESGFCETGHAGTITAVGEGRVVKEIDGEIAATKYDQWTCGLLSEVRDVHSNERVVSNESGSPEPLMILAETSPWPLAVEVDKNSNGDAKLRIVHPLQLNIDGSIRVASGVSIGDKIHLVHGTRNRLVRNLPILAQNIMERISDAQGLLPVEKEVCGALSIYCGGCLLHIKENITDMTLMLREELDDPPAMCIFTFGEVGAWPGDRSYLGNLMNSILVFTTSKLVARVIEIESGRMLVEGYKEYNQVAKKCEAMRRLSERNERERMGHGVRQLTESRKRSSLFINTH